MSGFSEFQHFNLLGLNSRNLNFVQNSELSDMDYGGMHPTTYKLLSIDDVSKRWREAEKLQGLLNALLQVLEAQSCSHEAMEM